MAEPRPTVRPRIPMDVPSEVQGLKKAMKGMGTDEAAIIKILAECSNNQRQVIHNQYDATLDRDLMKDLKKELSGDFEEAILALMTPNYQYLAMELHQAFEKKNYRVMVEIICNQDSLGIKALKEAYKKVEDDSLEEDLEEATQGLFKAIMMAFVMVHRSHDFDECHNSQIGARLYNGGRGLDEVEVAKILSKESFKQLQGAFVEYYKLAGRTLGETFDIEYKGSTETGMKAIFDCLQNRYAFFAESLHKSMAGPGTNERDLIRLVVSRSEIDLVNIKEEYMRIYQRSLENDIKNDTSGDFKKVLLTLVS